MVATGFASVLMLTPHKRERGREVLEALLRLPAVGPVIWNRCGLLLRRYLMEGFAAIKVAFGITDRRWDYFAAATRAFQAVAEHMGYSLVSFPPRSSAVRALGKDWFDEQRSFLGGASWNVTVCMYVCMYVCCMLYV